MNKFKNFVNRNSDIFGIVYYSILVISLLFIGKPVGIWILNVCWLMIFIELYARDKKWPAYLIVGAICFLCNLINFI